MPLEFRNLSPDYRIGFSTRRGRPAYINLKPGETYLLALETRLTGWDQEVKQEIAMYVEKGVLSVWDSTAGPAILTAAQILAY